MSELASLLPLVAIGLLFWLLLIRPQTRRQRELRQMQAALEAGNHVILASGIYGVVRSLDDERIRVEIAPGVVVEVARGAVGQRLAPPEGTPETTSGTEDDARPEPTDTTDTTGER